MQGERGGRWKSAAREVDSDRVGTFPTKPKKGGRRGWGLANTGKDSMAVPSC
jgi:hypothetical protein